MTANMGTHGNPEGVPHWTAKSLLAHRLRRGMQNAGRGYAAPFSRELRNVSIPCDAPEDLKSTLRHEQERVDCVSPLAFAIFDEPPHDACAGGFTVVNLLGGMRKGDVKCEEPFGNYLPDIALYSEGASSPHIVIEVVHTNSPSERKRDFYKAEGVIAFELSVDDDSDIRAVVGRTAVRLSALSNTPCGHAQREKIGALDKYIIDKHKSGYSPFVGIKFHPSGAQEYIKGIYDRLKDEEWHYGEPEVLGFCPTPVSWNSPPRIAPLEKRSLPKSVFLAYMVTNIERLAFLIHDERSTVQEKKAFLTLGRYAQDLLYAMHVRD